MRAVILSVVLFAAASYAPPLLALSCAFAPRGPFEVVPEDGATAIPTNARIWIGGGVSHLDDFEPTTDPLPLALYEVGGDQVPTTESVIEASMALLLVTVLTPTAELAPATRYQVRVDDEVVSEFTTATSALLEGPPIPRVASVTTRTATLFDEWGGYSEARFQLEGEGLLFVADRDASATLDDAALMGTVADLASTPAAYVGRHPCGGNWPEAGALSSAEVRFAAFDIAGNFSGWSEPENVTLPLDGCECAASRAASSAPPWGTLALLVAALLTLRRRWRPGTRAAVCPRGR